MNRNQAQEYQANLLRLSARHTELVQEYTHPEFHLRGQDENLEAALTEAGEKLAYTPPLMEVQPGVWQPKGKGLTHVRLTTTPILIKPMATVIPVEEWGPYIADKQEPPSVKAFVVGVKDQGSNGSCTCESGTGGCENDNNFRRGDKTVFNPLGTYGRINGGRDGGSNLEDFIAFAQEYGNFPEAVWPRSKGWSAKPTPEAYAAAANYKLGEVYECKGKAEFGTALIQRKRVHFWYDSHAVLAVSLLSATQFEYLNSWDPTWGNAGYGTMALNSLSYSGFYVYGSTELPGSN